MLTKLRSKIKEIKWYILTGIPSAFILFFLLSIRPGLNITKESPYTELVQIFASLTAISVILFFTWFLNFMSDVLFGSKSPHTAFYCPECRKTINLKHIPPDRSRRFPCPSCNQPIIPGERTHSHDS